MSTQTAPPRPKPGSPIPLPANFPVEWENPDDAKRMWTIDRIHSGEVVPILAACRRKPVEQWRDWLSRQRQIE